MDTHITENNTRVLKAASAEDVIWASCSNKRERKITEVLLDNVPEDKKDCFNAIYATVCEQTSSRVPQAAAIALVLCRNPDIVQVSRSEFAKEVTECLFDTEITRFEDILPHIDIDNAISDAEDLYEREEGDPETFAEFLVEKRGARFDPNNKEEYAAYLLNNKIVDAESYFSANSYASQIIRDQSYGQALCTYGNVVVMHPDISLEPAAGILTLVDQMERVSRFYTSVFNALVKQEVNNVIENIYHDLDPSSNNYLAGTPGFMEKIRAADKEKVLELLRKGGFSYAFRAINPEFLNDKEFMLKLVEIDHNMFMYVPSALQMDKDIALAAVRGHGWHLQECPYELQSDIDVIVEAYKSDPTSRQFAPHHIREVIEDHRLEGTIDAFLANPPKNLYLPRPLCVLKKYMSDRDLRSTISNYADHKNDMVSVDLEVIRPQPFGNASLEVYFGKDDYLHFLKAFYDVATFYDTAQAPEFNGAAGGNFGIQTFTVVRDFIVDTPVFNLEDRVKKAIENEEIDQTTLANLGLPQEWVPAPEQEDVELPEVQTPELPVFTSLEALIAEAEATPENSPEQIDAPNIHKENER